MPFVSRCSLVLVLLATSVALAQGGWSRYGNARYGYAIDYPGGFVKGEAPANNDGRTFTSSDGASLDVYGSNNVLNETLASAFKNVLREKGKAIAYKASGRNWFVVSWRDGGKIFYQKQFVGSGSMNAFIFAYPASRASAYAGVVTRLERSFKPGDLSQVH